MQELNHDPKGEDRETESCFGPPPSSAGVSVDLDVVIPTPALIKPRQLWTGKQLLSSLVAYYTRGQPPLTLEASCKVPVDYWGRTSDEGKFVFHKGELVAGCLDKAQFGKYGLVHAVQVRKFVDDGWERFSTC